LFLRILDCYSVALSGVFFAWVWGFAKAHFSVCGLDRFFGLGFVFSSVWLWCELFFFTGMLVSLVVGAKHVEVIWLWSRLYGVQGLAECMELF
jgi:hypothetical protein